MHLLKKCSSLEETNIAISTFSAFCVRRRYDKGASQPKLLKLRDVISESIQSRTYLNKRQTNVYEH